MENDFEKYRMQCPDRRDSQKYVIPFEFNIFYQNPENPEANGEECGYLELYFANVRQIVKDGLDCDEVLESKISDFPLIRGLYKYDYESGNWTCDLTENACQSLNYSDDGKIPEHENFVYIQTLEIFEKHRGKGVGIYNLKKALNFLAANFDLSFFVMIPHPLQDIKNSAGEIDPSDECKQIWHEQRRYDKLEKDKGKSLEKLRKLYGDIGFNLVEETRLMVCRVDKFL